MKRIAKAVTSFRKMIRRNYLYVDKTEHIYNLISNDDYLFLSRPRRFGKSLLISTLEELFKGNKELFDGLWIDSKADYEWKKHPVIRVDFSMIPYTSPEELKRGLHSVLDTVATSYGIEPLDSQETQTKLHALITNLSSQGDVVILVDEYDYPLLKNITKLEVASANREVLSGFYATIKGLDEYLRCVFITGISKFSKASVFSGMNNLNDISLKPEAATLLGYTHDEIMNNFGGYLEAFSEAHHRPIDDLKREMKQWYNGYAFTEDLDRVYNPFSIHYYLNDQKRRNYWFSTATPSFLMALISDQTRTVLQDEDGQTTRITPRYTVHGIEHEKMTERDTQAFDFKDLPLHALLYQTGYLTITGYDEKTGSYSLSFPNQEVKRSFMEHLSDQFVRVKPSVFSEKTNHMQTALEENRLEDFISIFDSLLSTIPYHLFRPYEVHYQTIFYIIASAANLNVRAEEPTANGRIDAIIDTGAMVYIVKFKLDAPALQALDQIKEKEYYKKYRANKRHITLVGISFDTKKRAIGQWLSESVRPEARSHAP